MEDMVIWPGTLDYEDSGEGGLFAWMIVPEYIGDGEPYGTAANTYGNNCHVDVTAYLSRPRVLLKSPDVCVSPEGRKVFMPWKHRDSWFDHSQAIDKRLNLDPNIDGDRRLRMALLQTLGADDISVPMLASVFLGSTGQSLYSNRQGGYFAATKDDLTLNGKTLYNAFQQVYGVDPIILTFLDT
jgi:hypothetical protein